MNIQDVINHQRAFLDQLKARKKPVVHTIQGIEIIVNPGVFPQLQTLNCYPHILK